MITASVSIVDAMSKLSDHETLSIPFRIGGIVGGIAVTHWGYIFFLPRSVGLAYFSKSRNCTQTLEFDEGQ